MKDTPTPHCQCPACKRELDGAFDWRGNSTPRPGDISVCCYCGHMCVFNHGLTLRSASAADFMALKPELREAIAKTREMLRRATKERE